MRRFLSNYFDLLLYIILFKIGDMQYVPSCLSPSKCATTMASLNVLQVTAVMAFVVLIYDMFVYNMAEVCI